MNKINICLILLLLLMPFFLAEYALALDDDQLATLGYSDKGADTCIRCHDEDNEFPVLPIFKTKHAQQADKRTPFAQLQCESCHGPGRLHSENNDDDNRGNIINFGATAHTPVKEQNEVCLSCHQDHSGMAWQGSAHETEGVACASCHSLHSEHDQAQSKKNQAEVCFSCHKKERAELFKRSSHPLKEGLMVCSDCHSLHGGGDKSLNKATINESCYRCHAEKRGPFLWSHAPVDEDCSLCHNAHGSNHEALLTKRATLLCKQCHATQDHTSLAPSGSALPENSVNTNSLGHAAFGKFLVSKSCGNCHSQIHGSNHPSGVKLTR